MRLVKNFFYLLILIGMVTGCETNDQRSFAQKDYLQRIANTLNRDVSIKPDYALIRYPKIRDLQAQTSAISISWSDFFNSFSCPQLQLLIAERNSQLGKNMESATKLIYEMKLITYLKKCSSTGNQDNSVWRKVLEEKLAQKNKTIFNLTWGSEYAYGLFSPSQLKVQVQTASVEDLLQQLLRLRVMLMTDELPEDQDWYNLFEQIEKSQGVIGSVMVEAEAIIWSLNKVSELISNNSTSICQQKQVTRRFEVLKNIINKFYFQKLQKRQSVVINLLQRLELELNSWEHWFQLSPSFNQWWLFSFYDESEQRLSQRMKQASIRHVEAWQTLAQSCQSSVLVGNL